LPKPAVTIDETPLPEAPVDGHPALPLAVARGRVFWRVMATSRRLELAQAASALEGRTISTRTGKQTGGRLTRRARTWWRRRNQSSQNAEVGETDETPKMNNNLG
jgi:hypothetical protein